MALAFKSRMPRRNNRGRIVLKSAQQASFLVRGYPGQTTNLVESRKPSSLKQVQRRKASSPPRRLADSVASAERFAFLLPNWNGLLATLPSRSLSVYLQAPMPRAYSEN